MASLRVQRSASKSFCKDTRGLCLGGGVSLVEVAAAGAYQMEAVLSSDFISVRGRRAGMVGAVLRKTPGVLLLISGLVGPKVSSHEGPEFGVHFWPGQP